MDIGYRIVGRSPEGLPAGGAHWPEEPTGLKGGFGPGAPWLRAPLSRSDSNKKVGVHEVPVLKRGSGFRRRTGGHNCAGTGGFRGKRSGPHLRP